MATTRLNIASLNAAPPPVPIKSRRRRLIRASDEPSHLSPPSSYAWSPTTTMNGLTTTTVLPEISFRGRVDSDRDSFSSASSVSRRSQDSDRPRGIHRHGPLPPEAIDMDVDSPVSDSVEMAGRRSGDHTEAVLLYRRISRLRRLDRMSAHISLQSTNMSDKSLSWSDSSTDSDSPRSSLGHLDAWVDELIKAGNSPTTHD